MRADGSLTTSCAPRAASRRAALLASLIAQTKELAAADTYVKRMVFVQLVECLVKDKATALLAEEVWPAPMRLLFLSAGEAGRAGASAVVSAPAFVHVFVCASATPSGGVLHSSACSWLTAAAAARCSLTL